jgi:DNA polymerase
MTRQQPPKSELPPSLRAWLDFYSDIGLAPFVRRAKREGGEQAPHEESRPVPAAAPREPAQPKQPASPPVVFAPPLAATLSLFEEAPARAKSETLEEVRADLGDCQRCKLAPHRKHIVFGVGNPRAQLVFVGEGPGAEEDLQGLPFVGRAGQLLTQWIESLGLKREQVYICNVIKCRPPQNRTPERDEIETCSPFLLRQLDAIRPKLVCALGGVALQTLMGKAVSITRLRGQVFDFRGTKLIATFHPAYILRNPAADRDARKDLQLIRQLLA